MRTGVSIGIAAVLMAIVLLSMVSYAIYVSWIHYVNQVVFESITYNVIGGKGIASTEYTSSGNVPVYIYPMFSVYETTTGFNYTLIDHLDENGTLLSHVLIHSSVYQSIHPEEAEVSPDNKYVVYALQGIDNGGDKDAILILTDLDLTKVQYYILDGINQTHNYTGFFNLFIASNNHVYVVGYVFDSVNAVYDGILVDFYYNGTGLEFQSLVPYVYNDPNGISNHLFFTDVTIGPDGYLYIAGYVPYYSSGLFYDYKGLIIKVDPFTYNRIGYVEVALWNNVGYVGGRTYVGRLCADDTYLYAVFNTLSDTQSTNGDYTRAAVIEKLDTSLNGVWEKIWNDIDYNNLIFDIVVTKSNLTIVGLTDNNYGYTAFQGLNAIVLTLNPADGSAKHGYLVGGSGDEVFEDATVDYKGYLYTVGNTTTDLNYIYEAYLSSSQISLTLTSKQHYNISNAPQLKPALVKPGSPLEKRIVKPQESPGESKPASNTGGLSRASPVRNPVIYSGDKLIMASRVKTGRKISGPIGLQEPSKPGIAVKYAEPLGLQPTPPPPVPEDNILIILGVIAGLGLVAHVARRRR